MANKKESAKTKKPGTHKRASGISASVAKKVVATLPINRHPRANQGQILLKIPRDKAPKIQKAANQDGVNPTHFIVLIVAQVLREMNTYWRLGLELPDELRIPDEYRESVPTATAYRLSVRMPASLFEHLQAAADQQGVYTYQFINWAVQRHMHTIKRF